MHVTQRKAQMDMMVTLDRLQGEMRSKHIEASIPSEWNGLDSFGAI